MDWQKCMNHAVDYIENNLSNEIDYCTAARFVGCSVWEFHRHLSFMAQIPLSEYIRRRRLTLAATDIQSRRGKIIDVALRYGYESQSAFSRAFSQLHGVPPSSARDEGVNLKAFPRLTFKFILQGVEAMDYHIENTLSQYSKYPNGNDPNGTGPNAIYSYAVSSYDNHDNTRGYFYYTIGAPYNGREYCENLEIIHIPSGSYAVFVMPPSEEVGHFSGRIFREWLPASGYQLTGDPELELSSSKTDIIVWLPIRQ